MFYTVFFLKAKFKGGAIVVRIFSISRHSCLILVLTSANLFSPFLLLCFFFLFVFFLPLHSFWRLYPSLIIPCQSLPPATRLPLTLALLNLRIRPLLLSRSLHQQDRYGARGLVMSEHLAFTGGSWEGRVCIWDGLFCREHFLTKRVEMAVLLWICNFLVEEDRSQF